MRFTKLLGKQTKKSPIMKAGLALVSVGTLVSAVATPASAAASAPPHYPFTVTIMTAGSQLTHAAPNSPLWEQLQKDTRANINVNWITSSNYDTKVSVELASGAPPMIMRIIHFNSDVDSAAESGAFWDLTPYIKHYKYLAAISPIIYNNIKINGQIYGIPAVRNLASYGIVYRKDWLKNVGLPVPKTITQFYNMLYAFTYDDPNKDGKNDTYGMALSSDLYPLGDFMPAFGVPNGFALKRGKLIPAQQTQGYIEALAWFHKLYVNKLINQNFPEVPVTNEEQPFLNGQAGVVVRLTNANDFITQNPSLKGKIGVLGPLKGPGGIGDYGSGGNDGMFVIPKAAVKTVAELKQVLSFLNAMSSPTVENLLYYGVKGQNYKLSKKGLVIPINQNNTADTTQMNDVLELTPLVPSSITMKTQETALQKQVTHIETVSDIKHLVNNPVASLYSQTEVEDGTQLSTILSNAEVQFIAGQISFSGVEQANQQWLKDGGQQVINQYQADLVKSKSKSK